MAVVTLQGGIHNLAERLLSTLRSMEKFSYILRNYDLKSQTKCYE